MTGEPFPGAPESPPLEKFLPTPLGRTTAYDKQCWVCPHTYTPFGRLSLRQLLWKCCSSAETEVCTWRNVFWMITTRHRTPNVEIALTRRIHNTVTYPRLGFEPGASGRGVHRSTDWAKGNSQALAVKADAIIDFLTCSSQYNVTVTSALCEIIFALPFYFLSFWHRTISNNAYWSLLVLAPGHV